MSPPSGWRGIEKDFVSSADFRARTDPGLAFNVAESRILKRRS
jgi:hypothetical protein